MGQSPGDLLVFRYNLPAVVRQPLCPSIPPQQPIAICVMSFVKCVRQCLRLWQIDVMSVLRGSGLFAGHGQGPVLALHHCCTPTSLYKTNSLIFLSLITNQSNPSLYYYTQEIQCPARLADTTISSLLIGLLSHRGPPVSDAEPASVTFTQQEPPKQSVLSVQTRPPMTLCSI